MNLLNTDDFNNFHMNGISYYRKIKNDVEIITNSTIIDKIAFIERVVQLFFFKFSFVFQNVKKFNSFNFKFNVNDLNKKTFENEKKNEIKLIKPILNNIITIFKRRIL